MRTIDESMSLTARIAQNTLVQIVGKIIAVFFGILAISMLTRYLGQSGFGAYTTAVAFVGFFGTLADLGLYIVTVKRISEHGADVDRVFSNIFTLRIVSALVFVVAAPLVVLLFPYPHAVKLGVLLLSASNLFITMIQLLTGVFQRALAMARASIAEVAGKLVFLGFIILFIAHRQPLSSLLIAVVAGSFFQFLILLALVRRFVHIHLAFDWPIWRGILYESWPVALSIALNLIYFRADTIILSLFHSQAAVGLYGASYKVLEVLVAFPAMFAGLIVPIISLHASRGEHDQFQSALQKGFDFMVTVSFPIIAGVFVLA
ncbi:MAG: oligosaccharide flippase family protein, partial [bacterium]